MRKIPLTILKDYREKQTPKLSQGALAKRLGVSRLTVTRWEIGERMMSTRMIPRVVDATNIPAQELRPDIFGSAA